MSESSRRIEGGTYRRGRKRQVLYRMFRFALWGAAIPFLGLYGFLAWLYPDPRTLVAAVVFVPAAAAVALATVRLRADLDTRAIVLALLAVLVHQATAALLLTELWQDNILACMAVLLVGSIGLERRALFWLDLATTIAMLAAQVLPSLGVIEQYAMPPLTLGLFHAFSILTLLPLLLYLSSEQRRLNEEFVTYHEHHIDEMEHTIAQASLVAKGELTVEITGEGELAAAFRQMVEDLRALVEGLVATASELGTSAQEIMVVTEHHLAGASVQVEAVHRNRTVLAELLDSQREVAETTSRIRENASRADENTHRIVERMGQLSNHLAQIDNLTASIKEIANKTDILALNAALEGTRAGEAGRGFSLVAAEMQRLASSVSATVVDIQELTASISDAAHETRTATRQGKQLTEVSASSAHEIGALIEHQQRRSKLVSDALDSVEEITRESQTGSEQIHTAARELVERSRALEGLVSRFRV